MTNLEHGRLNYTATESTADPTRGRDNSADAADSESSGDEPVADDEKAVAGQGAATRIDASERGKRRGPNPQPGETVYLARSKFSSRRRPYHTDPECPSLQQSRSTREIAFEYVSGRDACKWCTGEGETYRGTDEEFPCEYCERVYKEANGRSRHVLREHSDELDIGEGRLITDGGEELVWLSGGGGHGGRHGGNVHTDPECPRLARAKQTYSKPRSEVDDDHLCGTCQGKDGSAEGFDSYKRKRLLERADPEDLGLSPLAERTDTRIAHISRSLSDLSDDGLAELLVPEDTKKGRLYGLTDRGVAFINEHGSVLQHNGGEE